MIIIDLNQVSISNLMQQLGNHLNSKLDENMLRHMILNSIRSYVTKFGKEYGEIVIACDDKNYWRRQAFPYYKAHRKKAREQSELDWSTIFQTLEKIRNELNDNFPYKVIHIESAEADDVIGSLVNEYGNEDLSYGEKILILSGDKDFVQLQKYANVVQFDPIRKKWIKHTDPHKFLFEHICKGDQGDGIPNILSDDNTFVSDKRQKPMTQKKMDILFNSTMDVEHPNYRNFIRNKQLVDLSEIPTYIRTAVIDKYKEPKTIGKSKLVNYFIEHKLKNLMEHIGEF